MIERVQDYVKPWEIVMKRNDPSIENCFSRSASFLVYHSWNTAPFQSPDSHSFFLAAQYSYSCLKANL